MTGPVTMRRAALVLVIVLAAGCATRSAKVAPATAWNPRAWSDESTIELGVVRADGTPHWFKVWIVVLDDQAYVRLGGQSAKKLEENRTKPFIGVRIAGQEFPRVRVAPVPDDAERVATAMGDKYWSDVLIHLVPHPVTARLRPE